MRGLGIIFAIILVFVSFILGLVFVNFIEGGNLEENQVEDNPFGECNADDFSNCNNSYLILFGAIVLITIVSFIFVHRNSEGFLAPTSFFFFSFMIGFCTKFI